MNSVPTKRIKMINNNLEICPLGIILQPSPLYLLYLMQKWIGIPCVTNKEDKIYRLELKKDKVTCPLLQDFYQEDMEVPEVAKDILSEDSGDWLQKIKYLKIATSILAF